jgi:hypothetical protein
MLAFLDFEASSLARDSYPIEVAWVFEDGRGESWLIRPAPNWTDWDPAAESVHHISRAELAERGTSHRAVADRMMTVLRGHDLVASAPSWDGKWLSALLRAGGHPRHGLRLRDSEEVQRAAAAEVLAPFLSFEEREAAIERLLSETEPCRRCRTPIHRALPDAEQERLCWLAMRSAAQAYLRELQPA